MECGIIGERITMVLNTHKHSTENNDSPICGYLFLLQINHIVCNCPGGLKCTSPVAGDATTNSAH